MTSSHPGTWELHQVLPLMHVLPSWLPGRPLASFSLVSNAYSLWDSDVVKSGFAVCAHTPSVCSPVPPTDLDLVVPETVRLDSSLHKARAQLLAKGRRHRPSRSRLRDSASSAEDGEGSDGPGGKVRALTLRDLPHPPLATPAGKSPCPHSWPDL